MRRVHLRCYEIEMQVESEIMFALARVLYVGCATSHCFGKFTVNRSRREEGFILQNAEDP